MPRQARPRKAPFSVSLREALGFSQSASGQRVDRDKKILFGVKMGGWSSPNRHDIDGVDGTDYERAAITRALPLYEGLQAFSDHPSRKDPTQERAARDALGIYHNVRVGDDGWYGDLHLIPSHPLTEALLDVAENEKLAGTYSLSHNADGKGVVKGRRYVIQEILQVRSVDVVTRGATTKTLFESRSPMKTKLRAVVTESKLPAKLKVQLLELDAMDEDVPEPAAPDEDYRDNLVAAVGKLVKSDDEADHATAKKILALLEPEKAEELEESDEEDDDDGKKKKVEESDKDEDDKKDKEKKVEESRELFKLAGVKASTPLLEAAAGIKSIKGRLAFINSIKEIAPAESKGGTKPPPGAPRTAAVAESREGTKYADLLAVSLS